MKEPQRQGMIGFGTALALYAVLIAGAVVLLKGNARIILVLVVILLAVKTWVHRRRQDLD